MDEVGIFRALLEEYSPSGQEGPAVRRFVNLVRSLGFDSYADPMGNAIARIGQGPPTVLFLGHIDTVEGALPVRLDDARIYGRGACDAKGPLAAALVAASRHEGLGEIVVVGAVGEERDSRGARYLLTSLPRPDLLIVGEPSGWDAVTIGYRGNLSLVLNVEGSRAHLSRPGLTTVEKGLAIVNEFRAFSGARSDRTLFGSLTLKVSSINTILENGREHVEIGVNLRLPSGVAVRDVLSRLAETEARWDVIDQSEAIEVNPRNDVVRALCAGIRSQGARPTLLRKLGSSDLNLAAPAWTCPSAAYGPGDSHLDHTDGESVPIVDYHRAIAVLRVAFSRLTNSVSTTVRRSSGSVRRPSVDLSGRSDDT